MDLEKAVFLLERIKAVMADQDQESDGALMRFMLHFPYPTPAAPAPPLVSASSDNTNPLLLLFFFSYQ